MRIVDLRKEGWREDPWLLQIKSRGQLLEKEYAGGVLEIIEAVKERGDDALFFYAKKFDNVDLNSGNVEVTEEGDRASL